jgi:hypothetical protein
LPWEETDDYIRSGHGDASKAETCRTTDFDGKLPDGIKAIYCKVKGTEHDWFIQSYLFPKAKGWTMDKAKAWFEKHKESTVDEPHLMLIREKLVPFKTSILAAVPGKSLNNRNYSKDVLVQAAPFYKEKPFIMDHDVENSDKVLGIFTNSRYGLGKTRTGEEKEGLWLDGIGLMAEDLFDKVHGIGLVPPLIRGFSIGGSGDGEFTTACLDMRKFTPEEGSLTAFPGIPAAHIAQIEAIRESYRMNQKEEMKVKETKTKDSTEIEIPLEECEQQAKEPAKEVFMPATPLGPIPLSPDSKFNQKIPYGQDLVIPSYQGVPAVTKAYQDTNPANGYVPTPPSDKDIQPANNVLPPHTDNLAPGLGQGPQSDLKAAPNPPTLKAPGVTSPGGPQAEAKEVKCTICGFEADDDDALKHHMMQAHPGSGQPKPATEDVGTPTDFKQAVNTVQVTTAPMTNKPTPVIQPKPNDTVMPDHLPHPGTALGAPTVPVGATTTALPDLGLTPKPLTLSPIAKKASEPLPQAAPAPGTKENIDGRKFIESKSEATVNFMAPLEIASEEIKMATEAAREAIEAERRRGNLFVNEAAHQAYLRRAAEILSGQQLTPLKQEMEKLRQQYGRD